MIHSEDSPLAGVTVKLIHKTTGGDPVTFTVNTWWDRIQGTTWKESRHHLALTYAGFRQSYNLPDDDNVLYGHLADGSEKLVHVSEVDSF